MIIKRPHLGTSVQMVSCSVRPFWGWEAEEPLLEKVESSRHGDTACKRERSAYLSIESHGSGRTFSVVGYGCGRYSVVPICMPYASRTRQAGSLYKRARKGHVMIRGRGHATSTCEMGLR
jgi:hypothetical protein